MKIHRLFLFFSLFQALLLPLWGQSNGQASNAAEVLSNSNQGVQSNFLDAFYTGQDAQVAGQGGQPGAPTAVGGENIFFSLLRIAFITGLLGFLTWLVLKYFFRKNAVALSSGRPVEILAVVPAGLNVYFVVAKLHTLYYLMSLSSEGLRLLDKITDKEAIDFIEINKDITLPQEAKFVDLLQKMPEGKPRQALEYLRSQIERLRKK